MSSDGRNLAMAFNKEMFTPRAIATGLFYVAFTGGVIFSYADARNRISNNEKEIIRHEVRIESLETLLTQTMSRVDVSLAKLQVGQENMDRRLDNFEEILGEIYRGTYWNNQSNNPPR